VIFLRSAIAKQLKFLNLTLKRDAGLTHGGCKRFAAKALKGAKAL
jgi:hypothetical protein